MIHLLDELTLDAGELKQVLHLLDEELLPGRAEPLPQLLNRWVSPPVVVPGVPSTLWLLWQLPDTPAYYSMRGNPGSTPAVWPKLDRLCQRRRRHVLVDAQTPLALPGELSHDA
ncbi:hypothetical protein SAMN05216201_110164 [Pseudomonas linyingensis]|uniref:Uncharacterized protein n=1 Tax=Pseudomonas linyingensis TaxID=915471 RepID=A0A1H6ZQL6_9PSED|nr:hypothetical protein [Pseudomonas linyingensis]SEJ54464.1 hypothetical protein SAMN05216201_110164 [Pseudomonas linyingensis]